MNDVNNEAMEQKITNVLKRSRRVCIPYFIIVFILISYCILFCFVEFDDGSEGPFFSFLICTFTGFIIFILGQIIYQTFTLKTCKILLKSGTKDLPIKDISIKQWFIPFINLYKPYQILRDIYNYAKSKVGRNDNILINVRRISILSLFLGLVLYLIFLFDSIFENDFYIEDILPLFIYFLIFFISSSFVIFKLRKLYRIYLDNKIKRNI